MLIKEAGNSCTICITNLVAACMNSWFIHSLVHSNFETAQFVIDSEKLLKKEKKRKINKKEHAQPEKQALNFKLNKLN